MHFIHSNLLHNCSSPVLQIPITTPHSSLVGQNSYVVVIHFLLFSPSLTVLELLFETSILDRLQCHDLASTRVVFVFCFCFCFCFFSRE